MNFKSFYLTESLQTVYHALDIRSLIEILKNNSLELSPNVSNVETEMGNKKYYFLSTMRNKSGTYFLGVSKDTKFPLKNVYMELDHDYLKSRMKSGPVDYWKAGRKSSEEEERFWSDNDHLSDVSKFIKKIHVLLERDEKDVENPKKVLLDLFWQAKFKKIPIYFYDKPQNYVLGKNPIDVKWDTKLEYGSPKSEYVNDLDAIIKLMNDKKLSGKEAERLKGSLRYQVYMEDFITILTHSVHGGRKMTTGQNREFIKDFMDLMKKYKRKSVKEFVEKDVMNKMFERKLLFKH